MKTLFGLAFVLHCLAATAAWLTMDLDLGHGPVRRAADHVIDGYETVGFGEFFTGIVAATAVLGAFALWSWNRARKVKRAKAKR